MKYLLIMLSLASFNNRLMGMKPGSSRSVSITEGSSPDEGSSLDGRRSLYSSRSPGDFSILDARPTSKDTKPSKTIEQMRKDYEDEIFLKNTRDFISSEAHLLLDEIMQTRLHDTRQKGDPRVDLELAVLLTHLKMKNLTENSETPVQREPHEDFRNFKIRSDPTMRNEMDQGIVSLALLLNKLVRASRQKIDRHS